MAGVYKRYKISVQFKTKLKDPHSHEAQLSCLTIYFLFLDCTTDFRGTGKYNPCIRGKCTRNIFWLFKTTGKLYLYYVSVYIGYKYMIK